MKRVKREIPWTAVNIELSQGHLPVTAQINILPVILSHPGRHATLGHMLYTTVYVKSYTLQVSGRDWPIHGVLFLCPKSKDMIEFHKYTTWHTGGGDK